jgi:hypothetical protein
MRIRFLASIFALSAFSSSPAFAQSFGAELDGYTAVGALDGVGFVEPLEGGESDLLSSDSLEFRGAGTFWGGSLRLDLLLERIRLGMGVTAFSVDDVTVEPQSTLPPGVELETHSVWGLTDELYLGYELARGPVYPYLDLRTTLSMVQARVQVFAEPYGHLATAPYTAVELGLGPRFGVLVPIGHSTMLDIAVTHRLLGGVEQIGLHLGIGYWNNERDDPFSEELKRSPRGDF